MLMFSRTRTAIAVDRFAARRVMLGFAVASIFGMPGQSARIVIRSGRSCSGLCSSALMTTAVRHSAWPRAVAIAAARDCLVLHAA